MQLTYRGVQYDYNPTPVEIESVDVVGRYRGQAWNLKHALNLPLLKPALDIVYRGVSLAGGHYAT